MSSIPTWAIWSIIVPCVLLSPALAFLLATAVEIQIGCLVDAGAPALLALIIAGAGTVGAQNSMMYGGFKERR
jgi:hypothetical protein